MPGLSEICRRLSFLSCVSLRIRRWEWPATIPQNTFHDTNCMVMSMGVSDVHIVQCLLKYIGIGFYAGYAALFQDINL